MKVKIISDGFTAKVVNAETGEVVEGVTSAVVRLRAGDVARAELEVIMAPVELEAEANVREICPYCRTERR